VITAETHHRSIRTVARAVVQKATGAVCTHRPHDDDLQHGGYQAVQGTGRSTRLVRWTGGTERAMVVDGYVWSRLPGTDVDVRALTAKPLARTSPCP
jgi:hypothetical protein